MGGNGGQVVPKLHKNGADQGDFLRGFAVSNNGSRSGDGEGKFAGLHKALPQQNKELKNVYEADEIKYAEAFFGASFLPASGFNLKQADASGLQKIAVLAEDFFLMDNRFSSSGGIGNGDPVKFLRKRRKFNFYRLPVGVDS